MQPSRSNFLLIYLLVFSWRFLNPTYLKQNSSISSPSPDPVPLPGALSSIHRLNEEIYGSSIAISCLSSLLPLTLQHQQFFQPTFSLSNLFMIQVYMTDLIMIPHSPHPLFPYLAVVLHVMFEGIFWETFPTNIHPTQSYQPTGVLVSLLWV